MVKSIKMCNISHLILLVAFGLIVGGTFARFQDCENPPSVEHASLQTSDDDDHVYALYTCSQGYELSGSAQLICNLDTDEWHTDAPTCQRVSATSNGDERQRADEQQSRKKKLLDIPENPRVSPQMAATLDMSCVQAKVRAPAIRYGLVQKYDRRRSGDHLYLVAFYACNDRFAFEDPELTEVYCSHRQWVGELPVCVAQGEYDAEEADDEEDEGEVEEEYEDEYDAFGERKGLFPPSPLPLPLPPASPSDFNEVSENYLITRDPSRDLGTPGAAHSDAVTDINIIVAATQDPYTPRLLDQECGVDNGGCEQKCERLLFPGENEPRMRCSCYEGFSLETQNFSKCHDINECELPEISLQCPHGCENTYGSFRCADAPKVIEDAPIVQCPPGFQATATNECSDIDECATASTGCDYCHNTNGSFECTCPPGYKLGEDGRTCLDVNECEFMTLGNSEPHSICSHGCQNTPGSFICTCGPREHLSNDQHTCVPDTCEDLTNPAFQKTRCAHQCADLPSGDGYACICPTGYSLSADKYNCELAENACTTMSGYELCDPGTCHPNEDNANYSCHCPAGYANEGYACRDIDECAASMHVCSHTCHNIEGGYECSCPSGYRFVAGSTEICEDIDECVSGSVVLCGSLDCLNTPGSYKCVCPVGTQRDPESGRCQPTAADHCAQKNGGCSHMCFSTPKGPLCLCPHGMRLSEDAVNCVFEDFCAQNNGGCEQLCTLGSCHCRPGYTLREDGRSCDDIDECSINNGDCHQVCRNHEGGYECACERGFGFAAGSLKGPCLDVDECARGTHNCSEGLVCENLNGSFACLCPLGFAPNSLLPSPEDFLPLPLSYHISSSPSWHDPLLNLTTSCFDIDECSAANGNCSHFCSNSAGSFACLCPSGFELDRHDNRTCVQTNQCLTNNGGCSHVCVFQPVGGAQCNCPDGFELEPDLKTCSDIDECSLRNGDCAQLCTNVAGSFACSCRAGYQLAADGRDCEDVDECAHGQGNNCVFICLNLVGSYECACEAGFELAADERNCVPVCAPGFRNSATNPTVCEDIDECRIPSICQFDCLNLNGSYTCLCPSGYVLRAGNECEDVDECLLNNGGCRGGGICVNLEGSYRCRCPEGYALAADQNTCEPRLEVHRKCRLLEAPFNGEIRCTRYRHKKEPFYSTKCRVWCNQGYHLKGPATRYCDAGGRWDQHENLCLPNVCSRLPAPRNGVLMPFSCALGETHLGERCLLQCYPGYVPISQTVAVCMAHEMWSTNGTFDCARTPQKQRTSGGVATTATHNNNYNHPNELAPFNFSPLPSQTYGQDKNRQVPTDPLTSTSNSLPNQPPYRPPPLASGSWPSSLAAYKPYINCPRNTTVYLTAGKSTIYVLLQKPDTNLDTRYLVSYPPWAKNLEAHLPAGVHVVTFRVYDPATEQVIHCKTIIDVRPAQPPKVDFCPASFKVNLEPHQRYRSVFWKEPRFEGADNNGIRNIYKSKNPGELFGPGIHTIYYEATNAGKLTARCEFQIIVKAARDAASAAISSANYGFTHTASTSFQSQSNYVVMNSGALSNVRPTPGHDAYIICPDQKPIRVNNGQSVSEKPAPDWLIGIHYRTQHYQSPY